MFLTVYRVVSDCITDSFHYPLPAHFLNVLRVRDDEANVVVVLFVVPSVQAVADADVLLFICQRSGADLVNDLLTYDVCVIGCQ